MALTVIRWWTAMHRPRDVIPEVEMPPRISRAPGIDSRLGMDDETRVGTRQLQP
ncbi:hypothetical protein [Nocardia sp. NPDC056000]|uniref:hypothetical protein n=1 Tax=Nocardia sp. NPDC056000 TaxID=3345674 RepID=UPI0035E181D9